MRKLIVCILVVFSFFVLFRYCRFVAFPKLDSLIFSFVKPKNQIPTPVSKEECIKAGGEWRRPGPWPREVCMLTHPDANKFCIAGFQCMSGNCIAPIKDLRRPEAFATGTCQKYRILFGCVQEVHFGLTSQAVCLD